MLLSLLETIFAMYLMEKDNGGEEATAGGDRSGTGDDVSNVVNKLCHLNCVAMIRRHFICLQRTKIEVVHASVKGPQMEIHLKSQRCVCVYNSAKSNVLCHSDIHNNPPNPLQDARMTESSSLERLSDETKDLMKALTRLLDSKKEKEDKPGDWTRLTLKINRIFFIIYVAAVSLFLAVMCFIWQRNHQE